MSSRLKMLNRSSLRSLNYDPFLGYFGLILSSYLIGTIDIDLERKLVMHKEKDANIWKPPEIDHKEVEECKKFKAPAHQVDTKKSNLRRSRNANLTFFF